MKFVFDLDGTLSFDGVTIDDEIKQVLLRAEEFGHEVAFASARSYRDSLGLLGDSLSQQLVIGLNGGLAYRQGQLVYEEQLDKDVYREVLGFCRHYNLPFFVDDTFDYSGQILEKIPFVANVDPLKKAKYRSLEELTDPIKVVIYMVAMRSSWMRSSSGSKRLIRPISDIMRMKNASISIQQTRIKRQP